MHLVVCDDHKGLKAAVRRVSNVTFQRCRVHFMRNLPARAGKQGRRVVATAFAQETAEAARARWFHTTDGLRPRVPRLAEMMDDAKDDVLAYMSFPKEHRTKLHSTNLMERLFGEVKRRTDVVGVRRAVLPLEGPLLRLHSRTMRRSSDSWAPS